MNKTIVLTLVLSLVAMASMAQTLTTRDYTLSATSPADITLTMDPADRPLHLILDAINGIDASVATVSVDLGSLEQTIVDAQATNSIDLEAIRQEIEDSGVNASETTLVAAIAAVETAVAKAPVSEITTVRTVTLAADTSTEITSALTADNRRWIEIVADDSNEEFTVNYGAAATIGTHRKVVGGILLKDFPKGTSVHVRSLAGVDLRVSEGGY